MCLFGSPDFEFLLWSLTEFMIAMCRNLFHILTIGSSKPEHELYGFHRGYFVSPHHVAASIADFVAYFFSCDVCRTNFLVSLFMPFSLLSASLFALFTIFSYYGRSGCMRAVGMATANDLNLKSQ